MLLDAIRGKGVGGSAPQIGHLPISKMPSGIRNHNKGGSAPRLGVYRPYMSPPYIGSWNKTTGYGKKRKTKKKTGKGLILGKNSPFKNIPIIGQIL